MLTFVHVTDQTRFKVASNSECVCFNVPVGDRPACNVKVHVHRWMDKSPVVLLPTVYTGYLKYLQTVLQLGLLFYAYQQSCKTDLYCKSNLYLLTAL